MRRRLRHLGFPLLVLADLVASAFVTADVPIPATIPDYALRAAAVYRLEVGGACFSVVYLMAVAFFLALDGRGFVELGTRGVKAEKIAGVADDDLQPVLDEQMLLIRSTRKDLEVLEAAVNNVIEGQAAHEKPTEELRREEV